MRKLVVTILLDDTNELPFADEKQRTLVQDLRSGAVAGLTQYALHVLDHKDDSNFQRGEASARAARKGATILVTLPGEETREIEGYGPLSFRNWLALVGREVSRLSGVSLSDLADWESWGSWDAGMTPEQGAHEALAASDFPFEEGE